MTSVSIAGQMASLNNTPGGPAGSGGAGPVSVKTTNYSVTQNDNGTLFTNTGAGSTVTFTIPAGLAVGTTFQFYQNTTQDLVVKFSGSETCRSGNASITTAAGTLTYTGAGSVSLGVLTTIKKVSDASPSYWAFVSNVGVSYPTFA